jgi:hypothetical protein
MSERGTEPAYVFEDRQSPGDWHASSGPLMMAGSRWRSSPVRGRANGRSCSRSGAMAATKKSALTRVSGRPVIGSEAEEPRTALIGYEHPQIPAG